MIDVVVATYNRPEKLKRCLSSITGANRVIVVDDGSDPAAHFLEGIRIVEHTGLPGFVKHRGMTEATSPFVCVVDDDDWLAPDALATVEDYLRSHPLCLVLGTYHVEHLEGSISRPGLNTHCWSDGPHAMNHLVVMAREVYFGCGGFNLEMDCGVSIDLYKRLWSYSPHLLREFLYHRDLTGEDRIGKRLAEKQRSISRALFQR
jgi:glycosyltransferase involved in cell wall biosynthesis